MLKGQKKKEYQKVYMRNRRKKHLVRPPELDPVQPKPSDMYVNVTYPELDADGNPIPEYD